MSGEVVKTSLSLAALVIDARSKAVVPRAKVTFPDAVRPRTSHVTSDGYRVFVGIPAGSVRVLVTAPGYQPLNTTVDIPASPTLAGAVLEFALDHS
jgi:hypothetical protein